jgi:hypothetical protein
MCKFIFNFLNFPLPMSFHLKTSIFHSFHFRIKNRIQKVQSFFYFFISKWKAQSGLRLTDSVMLDFILNVKKIVLYLQNLWMKWEPRKIFLWINIMFYREWVSKKKIKIKNYFCVHRRMWIEQKGSKSLFMNERKLFFCVDAC